MIYLDSCAIVKLVTPETESKALASWLAARPTEILFTSTLAEVEVPRALRSCAPGVLGSVAEVLSRMFRLEINNSVRANAGAYVNPHLRSLDAVHLATAASVAVKGKTVSAFVTYDKRLVPMATELGLPVVAPGA